MISLRGNIYVLLGCTKTLSPGIGIFYADPSLHYTGICKDGFVKYKIFQTWLELKFRYLFWYRTVILHPDSTDVS